MIIDIEEEILCQYDKNTQFLPRFKVPCCIESQSSEEGESVQYIGHTCQVRSFEEE